MALANVNNTGWEHADFGLLPSQPNLQQPVLFQPKEMRQAIAQCIDRQKIATELSPTQPIVPDAYLPSNHPLYNSQVRRYTFDPPAARFLLDSLGWQDYDGDPTTPRQSLGVAGVPDGTLLAFSFLATSEPQKQRTAQIIKESLAQCGVQVDVTSLTAEALYAPGPDGPLFGRNFDMVQFGWATAVEPPCNLYTSSEIPGFYPDYPKGWGGANASGYSNMDYDRACQTTMNTLPDDPQHRDAHLQAQAVFAEDLPAIPLYWLSRAAALRSDLCNAVEASSGEFAFWNLELFDYGETCAE
jgi:peptide/nickel transport system substrate-binding protein